MQVVCTSSFPKKQNGWLNQNNVLFVNGNYISFFLVNNTVTDILVTESSGKFYHIN